MLSRGVTVMSALVSPLVMLALLIAGLQLSSNMDQSTDQPTHGHGAFGALLDETENLVGGGWDNRDDPIGRGCVIPFAVEGTSYPALRLGAAPRNVNSTVQKVTELWTGHGLAVEQTEISEVTQLTARGERDELVILRVSTHASTLMGESACVPN